MLSNARPIINYYREATVEALKTFDEKIAIAVEKVRSLKEEKDKLERRVEELKDAIRLKDMEIERLDMEKSSIKNQIEDLLNELETIGIK
jgi:chromosome segregation ATPase